MLRGGRGPTYFSPGDEDSENDAYVLSADGEEFLEEETIGGEGLLMPHLSL